MWIMVPTQLFTDDVSSKTFFPLVYKGWMILWNPFHSFHQSIIYSFIQQTCSRAVVFSTVLSNEEVLIEVEI